MAEVRIKVFPKRLEKKFKEAFEVTKRSKELQNDIGKFAVKRIAGFGKKGEPLNISRAFPALAPSTIRARARLRKFNKTGKPFRPSLSNLQLTGQFWKALTYEWDAAKGRLEVFWKNSKRKPYVISRRGTTAKQENTPTNAELFGFLREKGFDPFAKMDAKGIKTITNRVIRQLRKDLQNNFRRK
jgi:hypothetical protein